MDKRRHHKALIIQTLLQRLPDSIREALLHDEGFCSSNSIRTEVTSRIGDTNICFERSALYKHARIAQNSRKGSKLRDSRGANWIVRQELIDNKVKRIVLSRRKNRIVLPDFFCFSIHPHERLDTFNHLARELYLGSPCEKRWRGILQQRPLNDQEFDMLQDDLKHTPGNAAREIERCFRRGDISIATLVPTSRKYYDRLVGSYDETPTITAYASESGRKFIESLISWSVNEGSRFSFLLSAHSSLCAPIKSSLRSEEHVFEALNAISSNSDPLSKVGAIEFAMGLIDKWPKLREVISDLVHQIRDDNIASQTSEISLLSSLFVFVDGELARSQLFVSEPPFYRRLAACAQASLIFQQLPKPAKDNTFQKWAHETRSGIFVWQTLIDMRTDPRWDPSLASAEQMKEELMGRIVAAATAQADVIRGSSLEALILGNDSNSIKTICSVPNILFPGPLEGGEDYNSELPDQLVKAIEDQLKCDPAAPSSFIALVNASRIFRPRTCHVETAAKILKAAKHRLSKINDNAHLFSILVGLAIVAATSRQPSLSDELRILVRRYRSDPQHSLEVSEALHIGLIASASHSESATWATCVGNWIGDLAFGDLQSEGAELLLSALRCLLDQAPSLWSSCSRATAALEAFVGWRGEGTDRRHR